MLDALSLCAIPLATTQACLASPDALRAGCILDCPSGPFHARASWPIPTPPSGLAADPLAGPEASGAHAPSSAGLEPGGDRFCRQLAPSGGHAAVPGAERVGCADSIANSPWAAAGLQTRVINCLESISGSAPTCAAAAGWREAGAAGSEWGSFRGSFRGGGVEGRKLPAGRVPQWGCVGHLEAASSSLGACARGCAGAAA